MKFFQEYLEEKFAKKLYRVPLDLGLKCPYGNDLEQRCYFCDEDGARPAHLTKNMSYSEQVSKGVEFIRKKYGIDCGLIAYVQTHTGTNASADELEKIYLNVLSQKKFDCMIIATRPDALDKEKISLLSELSKKIELWVELGVQTTNDHTLERINRKHNFDAVKNSVIRLHSNGVNTAAHLILGLPGEGICDFRKTAEKISLLPFKAVKIHNLLILKNTVFEKWYYDAKIKTMNEYEYAAVLMDFIRCLRDDLLLMRLAADADEEKLIAPKWTMTKEQFSQMIKSMLSSEDKNKYTKTLTADGSWTLRNPIYKEYYRSVYGAKTESRKIFIDSCEIRKKIEEKSNVSIIEIGLGLGINLSETLSVFDECDCPDKYINYIALEKDLSGLEHAITLEILPIGRLKIFKKLIETREYEDARIKIFVIKGDARYNIKKISNNFDAIYLDPFSSEKNPELWTYDFIRELKKRMKDDAILATYSSAFSFRGALIRSGFYVGDIESLGRRRAGTIAALKKDTLPALLSEKELNIILKTTAGLAYRDPGLNNSIEKIRKIRAKIATKLRKKGIPKWLR